MNGSKSAFQSLTIIAAVIGIIATLFGIDLSPEDQALIAGNIDRIVTAVLFLVTIYGRVRATSRIQT